LYGLYAKTTRCPFCQNQAKKNGRRSGRQRYLCLVCKRTFVREKHQAVGFKSFCQFYQFVTGKVNRSRLLTLNSQCRKTLYFTFKHFFDKPPSPLDIWQVLPPKFSKGWIYAVDGKWLKRQGVFMLHKNITDRVNLYWSFLPGETYQALHADLVELTKLLRKQKPAGVVSDWKGAIVSAVAGHFGPIPHQRCLTHVVRQAKKLLSRKSPFICTIELRQIAKNLIKLKTEDDIADWFTNLGLWHDQYGYMLTVRTTGDGVKRKWWYTHGNLRRAWRLLAKNTEPFFQHIDHELLPHSNNSLEGTFSQAVNKLIDHRGMKLTQQLSFLHWYFALSHVKNKQQLKTLWDMWKMKKSKF
jgi:hypothetical protein